MSLTPDGLLEKSALEDSPEPWNDWKKKAIDKVIVRRIPSNHEYCGFDFSGVEFNSVAAHSLKFYKCDFYACQFAHAKLKNATLFKCNAQGARFTNCALDGIHISDTIADSLSVLFSNLANSTFSDSVLSALTINATEFQEAYFSRNRISLSLITKGAFNNVKFNENEFFHTQFKSCSFRGSSFEADIFDQTEIVGTSLAGISGLGTIRHHGPSSCDFNTLLDPSAHIPRNFLKGIGVREMVADYIPALTSCGSPFEYYSCFISHSEKDSKFVKRLYDYLDGKKIRTWYAPEDLQGGKKVHEQIDGAIRAYDRLIIILSHNSIKSNWVKEEICRAFRKEKKTCKRVLYPISLIPFEELEDWELFDGSVDLAREIRQYYIPTFPDGASDEEVIAGFEKLVESLSLTREKLRDIENNQ